MDILGLCFSNTVQGVATRHDGALVLISYLVATVASYTALDMAERLRTAPQSSRRFWRLGAALVLGGGVWSMHFIAMLAYRTPFQVQYDPGLTVLSGLVSMAATAGGLTFLAERTSLRRILGGGALVGLGVAIMHYMGMEAMRLPGQVYYRPGYFAASIGIAMAAASVALWLSVSLRTARQRAVASVVMATAICGMHFTGMAGTTIVAGPEATRLAGETLVSGSLLSVTIVACAALIITVGLMCAYIDRRLETRSQAEAERLRELNSQLETAVQLRTADLTTALAALDEQRRSAEKANRAKSDFLANMSHELRTPLNAVIGFADILRLGGELDARQGEAVEQIHVAGRHLLALIEEVLDFAKIESGKLSVSIEAVDPVAAAEGLVATFRPMAEKAQVALRVAPCPEAVAVRADDLRLKQVLANLISNAIKYNRPAGQVEVRTRRVGDQVLLDVRDTGLGIPAGRMADLFEPFERLGREGSAIEGAGLGLALTRRLVAAMGGKLDVQSIEGVGTTFTVELPAAAPIEAVNPAAALARPDVLGQAPEALVLYVEDNASNIRLMQHIADALGSIELHIAERPLEGLELAARLRPDVILLDINLPGMDGFQVKARLDADPATRGIPVIAISANVLTETMTRGQVSGFHSYLTKPIDIHALVAAIQDAVADAEAPEALSA
jgi:signal transduction histidine kinase/ActR/RegA family two-component response regulator